MTRTRRSSSPLLRIRRWPLFRPCGGGDDGDRMLNGPSSLAVLLFLLAPLLADSWVIYRRAQKRKLICKEDHEWGDVTPNNITAAIIEDAPNGAPPGSSDESTTASSTSTTTRRRRDVLIDPVHHEPVIILESVRHGNKTDPRIPAYYIDDGDFDLVSEHLTPDELAYVKEKIRKTCNNLDRNPPSHSRAGNHATTTITTTVGPP